MGRLRTRLDRLERAVSQQEVCDDSCSCCPTERDWLAYYEALGDRGFFANEPDFPTALAEYGRAVHEAIARADPPFDPPPEFQASLPHQVRESNWRDSFRFPAMHSAWVWLSEMTKRVRGGIPAVTEAEFRSLHEWFEANSTRLWQSVSSVAITRLGERHEDHDR